MKKLEIIIETIGLNSIVRILEKQNISGYSVIERVLGKGSSGLRQGGELSNVMKNVLVIVVDEPDKISSVVREVKQLLKDFSGIMFISDVELEN